MENPDSQAITRKDLQEGLDRAVEAIANVVRADIDLVKVDIGFVRADIDAVKADVGSVKADIESVKVDIGSVRADIGSVSAEVGSVRNDVGSVKADMSLVSAEINSLKADIDSVKTEIKAAEERSQEFARNIETNLLTAFHSHAKGQNARLHTGEVTAHDLGIRIAALEERMLNLETRQRPPQ